MPTAVSGLSVKQRPREPSPTGDSTFDDVSMNTYESSGTTSQEVSSSGSSSSPWFLRFLTSRLSPRWANGIVRLFTGIMLIVSFSFLISTGPLALVFLVILLQLACFNEIINIGLAVYRLHDLPWFRILSWQFLFASNYFLFGESIISHFRLLLAKENFLQPFITHHLFISYTLYSLGIVVFVLSLVKKHYLQQFLLFGWTHVTLLLIVVSSHFIIENIFNGIVWFLVPVALVICNDIMAYFFGFFFGKTPLIEVSPKKTWEGFIGGGLFTVLFGFVFSYFLVQYDSFVCPFEWDDNVGRLTTDCVRNPVFVSKEYSISVLPFLPPITVSWYPFWTHTLIIALYVSIVGPFGGFFASGFKRAFRLKDFGDIFPGHGGVMDRFDCQFIVGVFVYIYYYSFVRIYSPSAILSQIYVLPPQDQLSIYRILTDGLHQRGLLPTELTSTVLSFVDSTNESAATLPTL